MYLKSIVLSLCLLLLSKAGHSQTFSLTDTTITFRNEAGKLLSRGEVKVVMQHPFKTRSETTSGGKSNHTSDTLKEL